MKSIANQYRDLKEGKMSQFNFMRNLRMSMPQYITNVTSFKDAVRILKNKAILTESEANIEPKDIVKKYNELFGKKPQTTFEDVAKALGISEDEVAQILMSARPGGPGSLKFEATRYQSSGGVDDPSREDQSGMELSDDFYDAVEREIDRYGKYTPGYKDLFKFFLELEPENYENEETPNDAVNEIIKLFDLIKKGEDEQDRPEIYANQDSEGGLSEGKKKKAKKEEKPYNPNAIHPSELRMGIRVEMEHTDDPKKAEKIALDHLAENPFYYTALKLSGVESPSTPKAKPVAPKKIKKKDATELVDKDNQMVKVKLMKEALEKMIRAELRNY